MFGEERLLLAGTATIAVGLLAIPLSSTLLILVVATGLLAIGMGMTQPAINSLISRRAGASEQGEVMGVAQSFGSLARILGPAFAGALFGGFGRNAPYYAGAALMALVLATAFRLLPRGTPSLVSKSPAP
jgi:MFS transporter, DHA1 family, tetracycline resistance protein